MDPVPLILLGGLLALDGTAVGQVMVSRPLVAGVLTGWVAGDPAFGLLLGGILEVYFISIFPVGGGDFPEGGPPTVAAVAVGVATGGAAGVALGAALGLVLSRLGSLSIRVQRRVNGRLAPDPSKAGGSPGSVVGRHLTCVALDFGRGCVLTYIGVLVGGGVSGLLATTWPLEVRGTLTLLAIGASIPAGALLGSLGGWRKRGALFGTGLFIALLMGLVL